MNPPATETSPAERASLGALRIGLLALCALDILAPMLDGLLRAGSLWSDGGRDAAHVIIASAIAPILFVVLLFDYIMSRVRAADAAGAGGGDEARFRAIARVELVAMILLLAYWAPVIASLGR